MGYGFWHEKLIYVQALIKQKNHLDTNNISAFRETGNIKQIKLLMTAFHRGLR